MKQFGNEKGISKNSVLICLETLIYYFVIFIKC